MQNTSRHHRFIKVEPDFIYACLSRDDRIANGFCGACNLEVQLGFAALVVRSCGDFAASLKQAGDAVNATKYAATAKRLAAQLRARPSTGGGAWHEDYGVHAAAYAINAKILATGAEVETLVHRELSDAVTVCSWSPFNNYWILQGLGNAGKMDQAAAFIKLCWAPMLKLGKGCFWELFSPEWATWMLDGDKAPTSPSYCHPWASGVTHWLSQSMGGVQPLEPGYRRFLAMPHVSGRNTFVSVTQPTPHGPISVAASRDTTHGTVTVRVKTSRPVPCTLCLSMPRISITPPCVAVVVCVYWPSNRRNMRAAAHGWGYWANTRVQPQPHTGGVGFVAQGPVSFGTRVMGMSTVSPSAAVAGCVY